jgi:hypothetical protein
VTDAALQRIADELGEPIEIVRGMADAIECCANEGPDAVRTDRWERARDAAFDAPGAVESQMPNIDAAIETAIRVRVDADMTQAVRDAYPHVMITSGELRGMIEVAMRAAGFEVEQ